VVAPYVPTNSEIKIEAITEDKWALQILGSHAVKRLGAVQHDIRIIRVRGTVRDPTRVLKAGPFKTFGKQISRRSRNSQNHWVTGGQRSVDHCHSDGGGAGLICCRRDRYGAISATAPKDDI